jgi:signal transduction histidine kinase
MTRSPLWGVETAAQQVVEDVMRAVPATVASVALWDQPSFALTIKAVSTARRLPGALAVGARVPLAGAPWHRWVFERQEPVLLEHDIPDRHMSTTEVGLTLIPELQTIFLVPIQVAGEVIGVLALGEMRSRDREPFGADKQRHCLGALERAIEASAQAWEAGRLRRHVRLMSSFVQIVREMLYAHSLDEVLASLGTRVSDWLGAPVRGVLIRAYPEGRMEVVARWQLPEAVVQGDAEPFLLALVRSGEAHNGPVTVVKVADDPLDPFHALLPAGEIWTRVCLPLMHEDKLLGVVCLYVEDDLHPGGLELEAFRWLAQVTGVWIELVTTLIEHRHERDRLHVAAWELLTTHQRTVVDEALSGIGQMLVNALPARLEAVAPELDGGSTADAERRQRLAAVVLREIDAVVDTLRHRTLPSGEHSVGWFDLNDLVQQAIQTVLSPWRMHPGSTEAPVPVEFEASREPILIQGSVALLGAIAHVIGNAVEAVSPGGRVRVRTLRESDDAIIQVADTGPGIPEDLREEVFSPFMSTKSGTHLGLGLSVVRSSLKRYGGEVALTEADQGGTVLHLRLPILRPDPVRRPGA